MQAVILAAGRGKRMLSLTKNTPKPLLKVGGKTLIEYAIETLKKENITDIIINISYKGAQIKKFLNDGKNFGVHIRYSDEKDNPLETAGGIIKALPLLENKPFVAMGADIICDYDLKNLPKIQNNILAHLVLVKNPIHHKMGDFVFENGYLTLIKKPNKSNQSMKQKTWTFSGIGLYHPLFFENYRTKKNMQKKTFKEYIQHVKIPLSKIFTEIVQKNKISKQVTKKISASIHSGLWFDVGTPSNLEEVNAMVGNQDAEISKNNT